MNRIIIVGSGLAATSAALEFSHQGIKIDIIDAGLNTESSSEINKNFYEYAERNDTFDLMIGDNYEGLYNLMNPGKTIPAKLVAPRLKFVTELTSKYCPLNESNFSSIQSLAKGGLANAWGAGLYEYDDHELSGFPISKEELKPFYKKLENEIGISGTNDDLSAFLGHSDNLQPPLKLSRNASYILDQYKRRSRRLNDKGFFLGRPRLGVLSENRNGRTACKYKNDEFWLPDLPSIYNPKFTLEKLIRQRKVEYHDGYIVKKWKKDSDEIEVLAHSISKNRTEKFNCDILILAAGPINTAKIVLSSRNDFKTRLNLFDNYAYQIPFFILSRVGAALETDAFGLTQLNAIYHHPELNKRVQASILELTGPSRAEFYSYFPTAAKQSLRMIKYFLPSMMVMQLFLPEYEKSADLFLNRDGILNIVSRKDSPDKKLSRSIVRFLQKLRVITHSCLIFDVQRGQSIHYAGTLPMTEEPRNHYQCDRNGLLKGESDIYIVDGSLFPYLPARNYSFTVMANSMRICNRVSVKKRKNNE